MIGIAIIALAFFMLNGFVILCKGIDKEFQDMNERIQYLESKIKYNETADKYKID